MKKNAYECSNGHITITEECDEGVTSFLIRCTKDDCNEVAKSMFGQIDQESEATHEWYKPSTYENLTDLQIEHVKNGGLILRPK